MGGQLHNRSVSHHSRYAHAMAADDEQNTLKDIHLEMLFVTLVRSSRRIPLDELVARLLDLESRLRDHSEINFTSMEEKSGSDLEDSKINTSKEKSSRVVTTEMPPTKETEVKENITQLPPEIMEIQPPPVKPPEEEKRKPVLPKYTPANMIH